MDIGGNTYMCCPLFYVWLWQNSFVYSRYMRLLETYPHQFASENSVLINVLFWGGLIFLYIMRHRPGFDKVWGVIKWFLLALITTIAWNNIKDKFRK